MAASETPLTTKTRRHEQHEYVRPRSQPRVPVSSCRALGAIGDGYLAETKQMRYGPFGATSAPGPVRSALALMLMLIMPACGSDGNPGSPSGSGGGGGSSLSPGTMTATIDGVAWTGTINTAVVANGSLIVSAAVSPTSSGIALASPAQVGTQTVGSGSAVTAVLLANVTSPSSESWLAAGPTGSGSMTISTLTATSATGTFFFTLVPNPGTGQNRVVSNGAFNARIPTP